MPNQIFTQGRDASGADSRQLVDVAAGGRIKFNAQGQMVGGPAIEHTTYFTILPGASALATTDPLYLLSGTGTEVVARAVKGGINIKSQATTPADGDNVLLAPAATTLGINAVLKPNAQPRFEARVAINTITALFASFGFDENITDADPTGTAGEGARFLFSPTGPGTTELTVDTGLTLAQHANWILAHKVNGADTFTATTVPVIAGRDYELVIQIGSDLKAKFYIDGVLVGTGPALTDGDTVASFIGLELTGTPGEQKDVDVRYITVGRSIG